MRAQIIGVLLVACGRSAQPPPPSPPPPSPGSGADAAIATTTSIDAAADPATSFYCFRDFSDPAAVQTLCWRTQATCDKYARQVGPDKPPTCTPAPSVYCYTSTDDTGSATTCTPASTDCDKLRTIESEHNRHDPKLTACAADH